MDGRGTCRRLVHIELDLIELEHGLAQDEVLMLNCGHCIKTAHHALLMLVGVLALELLAHRVAELHVRRWVVGWCAAWRALEPLRAPSGRGRLAKRFGGRAWLAHLGYYRRGCAHREREGASSGGKEQCGASDAGYARKEQRAVVSIRWQDARKESSF
jgi:hypothetical protein